MEGKDTLARINMHFGYLKTIINSAMPLQNGSKINTTMFIAAPYHLYMIESLMSEVLKSKDAELEQSDEEARESWSEADDWQLQFDELQKDYNKLSLKYAELENKYRSLADKNVDMSIAFAIIRIYDNAYKAFNNSYIESATSGG